MIASQAIGSVIGLPLAIFLPDRFGRKIAILVGNVIIIGGAIGQTFTNGSVKADVEGPFVNLTSSRSGPYIATRFIVGFGVVVATNAAPSLATELAHPRMFGRVASYYNVCFYVGSIIAVRQAILQLRCSMLTSPVLDRICDSSHGLLVVLASAHHFAMCASSYPDRDFAPVP